jgi:alpha-galactosidase
MKALFGLAILILSTNALNNGEALTPAMGWNSWNYFNCGINEEIAMQIADAMVSTGLLQAGYKYLNIDDCWAYSRYPNGTIQADPTTFPQGMAYLANYVHS